MAEGTTNTTLIYEFLYRTTSDGVLILDETQRIIHLNPAAAAMLGVTLEDALNRYAPDYFRKNQALVQLVLKPGEQKSEVKLAHKRLAQGIAETMSTGERIVLLQDVTEKRALDDRREALAKAIAHDLRNPIAALTGFADLVQRVGALNEGQQKFLTRIRQTSSKLHDMIVSLVDLAWIEAGMPLAHVPIRLDELIDQTVRELSVYAQRKQLGIAVSVQKPLPIVMGDPERLKLVVYHLLHNALIYSLTEQNIVIHAWGDDHELFCSVADRGIGIAPHELDLVFDRMYRARDERVLMIAGGGLGLTVARTIIRRHGGEIRASSILNEGSTFMFSLPTVQL